jgi:NAD(P)-dependent dehydrogenase (short-subunit alcohol dehydrogenase family)
MIGSSSASTNKGPEGQLKDKVAVVTGSGSGIGRAMAQRFAESGAKVMVVDAVPERVKATVAELSAFGVKGLTKDLSAREEPARMVDECIEAFGRLDILCNNAGIMDGVTPVADTSDELWGKVMDINLNAPFRASRRAIPTMLKQGSGVILNTASVAALFGGMAGAAYTTSKTALIGLTRSIASSYGQRGIRCNAMVLGGVNTNIGLGAGQPSQAGLEHLMKIASLSTRMAEPKEIAELALFLVSGNASYVNGSAVVIDGGWTTL